MFDEQHDEAPACDSDHRSIIARGAAMQVEQANHRAQHRQRPGPDAMNVISLGAWLRLTEQLGIPSIPAMQITSIPISDIWPIFDGQPPASNEGRAAFAALGEAGLPHTILRWDCCAGYEVKYRLGTGHPEWHPDFIRPMIDDPRFADILYDYGERNGASSLPVWRRPWITAQIEEGYPVEFRVFARDGGILGLSSYYPQRPLPLTSLIMRSCERILQYSERLIEQVANFSADWLVRPDGEILFLEGGPPHHEGAHPCCFPVGKIQGLALAPLPGALSS